MGIATRIGGLLDTPVRELRDKAFLLLWWVSSPKGSRKRGLTC